MPGLFYPSMVVNFTLRFDEALTTVKLTPVSAEDLGKSGQPAQALVSKDNLSHVLGIVPKACTVELPAYRQAGQFKLTLEYKDFPIDPRVIRACEVFLHLGAVQASDFATGMNTKLKTSTKTTQENAERRAGVIQTHDTGGNIIEKSLLLVGLADAISCEHSSTGSVVSLEGRDRRGVLLDSPFNSALLTKLKLGQDIKSVVEQIVGFHPVLGAMLTASPPKFQILADPQDWASKTLPIVADTNDLTRVNKGAKGQKPSHPTKGGTSSLNYWDIITQYCYLVGVVPYFAGLGLHLKPARSLFTLLKAGQPGNPTPFANGAKRTVKTSNGTEDLPVRRVVYGDDINSFKLERKLAGVKVPAIMCVCTDTENKQVITARWPQQPTVTNVGPDGEAAQEEILTIPVAGINNKTRLEEIAQDIYEEIGRGEMGGSISTKDLASFGGDNQDPDLVYLRPGDATEVVTAANSVLGSRPPMVSELLTHSSRSEQAEVEALTQRLGDANLAKVLVATSRNSVQELQRFFRVSNVKFSWDAGTGLGIDFDFQNYVEARYAPAATSTSAGTKLSD